MVTLERVSNSPYRVEFGRTELENVAVRAKAMPDNFITAEGNFVTDELFRYMRPLIGDIPEYVRLERHPVEAE